MVWDVHLLSNILSDYLDKIRVTTLPVSESLRVKHDIISDVR